MPAFHRGRQGRHRQRDFADQRLVPGDRLRGGDKEHTGGEEYAGQCAGGRGHAGDLRGVRTGDDVYFEVKRII